MTTNLTLERGVLWFGDGTEVSNVSKLQLKHLPEAYSLLKVCEGILEVAMPVLDPSGDRQNPGWQTIDEIKSLLERTENES